MAWPRRELVNEWRGLLDRALASGQDALVGELTPLRRNFIERDIAIVLAARNDDLIEAMLTPEIITACMN